MSTNLHIEGAIPSPNANDTPPAEAAPAPPPAPEAPPADGPPPEAPPTDAPPQVDPRLAQILQREGQLVARERAIKEREEKYRQMREEAEQWRQDPIKTAEKYGASFDTWLSHYGSGEQQDQTRPGATVPPEIQAELEEGRKFRQQYQERQDQEAKRKQEADYQAMRTEKLNQINQFLENDPTFKMLHLAGAAENVYHVMEQHALQTANDFDGAKWLPPEQAAKQVLEWARPRLEATVKGLVGLPEFRDLVMETLGLAGQAPQPPAPSLSAPTGITPAVSSPAAPPAAHRELSREESLRKAASLLEFDGGTW